MRKYYAHSHAGIPAHELRDHLIDTASEVERCTKRIGLTGWGTPLGLAHDLGKFSDDFQRRVAGSDDFVDHSTFGGQLLTCLYGNTGTLLAYGVLGHHTGLPNGEDATNSCLTARLRRTEIPDGSAWKTDQDVTRLMPAEATMKADRIASTAR